MKKVNAVFLSLVMLLAVGCGGDDPEPEPDNQQPVPQDQRTCEMTKYREILGFQPFYEFFYNPAGQLIKVSRRATFIDKDVLLTYNSNGTVAKTSEYTPGAAKAGSYTLLTYNANAQLVTKTTYSIAIFDSTTNSDLTNYTYDAANRITKIEAYMTNQPTTISTSTEFFYNANGSIRTEMVNAVTGAIEVLEYTFDDKKNPDYGKFYLPENYSKYPYFPHNFTKMVMNTTYRGGQQSKGTQTMTYTYNADGYPVEAFHTEAGPGVNKSWEYNCQ